MKKKSLLLVGLILVLAISLVACGQEGDTPETPATPEAGEAVTEEMPEDEGEKTTEEGELTLYRAYQAPHGTKSFARVVVAMEGDKIVDVAFDEFQYFVADSGAEFVPNSDVEFGEGSVEDIKLGSKAVNDAFYSEMMAEKAGSTVALSESMQAIVDFTKGKTLDEIQETIDGATPGKPVDAISGATLVDTVGYLQAVVDTVKDPVTMVMGQAGDINAVELRAGQSVGQRSNEFSDIVVAVEGDKIIAATMDELYYMEGGEGVPNSDEAFGENYASATARLSSKLVNNEAYSAKMMEKANATQSYTDNMKGVEDFLAGKTAEEVQEVVDGATPGEPVDAITGATFTAGVHYLEIVLEVLK